ncbi:MAG TPA: hypothetical protein VIK72_09395 [Clostridiaceae bacterium]
MCVNFLIYAWLLNLFGFGDICISGMRELFNITITISSYYFMAFLIGLGIDFVGARVIRKESK